MIKIEHVVLPSPEQMEFVIEGMRNAHDSWDKSDSYTYPEGIGDFGEEYGLEINIGPNDLSLMNNLSGNGPVHSKYMRMMVVMIRITAPLYWWKEFDTYKVGTVSNGCSTMHRIHAKEFTLDDFSTEHLIDWDDNFECDVLINKGTTLDGYPCGISPVGGYHAILSLLNEAREKYLKYEKLKKNALYGINPEETIKKIKEKQKQIWWQLIQLLPSSYNQTRNIMLDYEVLKNIYTWRKDHKLDEWVELCKWIETLPYSEIITGGNKK